MPNPIQALRSILAKAVAYMSAPLSQGEPQPDRRKPVSEEDLALLEPIIAFARGDQGLRDAAIARHRELLSSHPHLRSHATQMFMAEIDTPVPDLGLRATARANAAGGRRASDRRAA